MEPILACLLPLVGLNIDLRELQNYRIDTIHVQEGIICNIQ